MTEYSITKPDGELKLIYFETIDSSCDGLSCYLSRFQYSLFEAGFQQKLSPSSGPSCRSSIRLHVRRDFSRKGSRAGLGVKWGLFQAWTSGLEGV